MWDIPFTSSLTLHFTSPNPLSFSVFLNIKLRISITRKEIKGRRDSCLNPPWICWIFIWTGATETSKVVLLAGEKLCGPQTASASNNIISVLLWNKSVTCKKTSYGYVWGWGGCSNFRYKSETGLMNDDLRLENTLAKKALQWMMCNKWKDSLLKGCTRICTVSFRRWLGENWYGIIMTLPKWMIILWMAILETPYERDRLLQWGLITESCKISTNQTRKLAVELQALF